LVLAMCGAGCGRRDGPKRVFRPVRGTIVLDGQPLAHGEIQFETPSLGHLDVCAVKDGRFAGEVGPGTRIVRICAFIKGKVDPGSGEPAQVNIVPARYSIDSKLTADVTASGPNEFHFEITSK
jgi:hypothetical protein